MRVQPRRLTALAAEQLIHRHAGTLVWRPYELDISKLVRPGVNKVKILVTNTEANQRAVGTRRGILAGIDIDGLEGPVRLIPMKEQGK